MASDSDNGAPVAFVGIEPLIEQADVLLAMRRVAPVSVTFPNHAEGAPGPSLSGTGDIAQNGNILAHADSVMGTWNFTYDAVDRLMTAQQTAVSPTVPASQNYAGKYGCWSYDSYGNRTLEAVSSTACNANPTPQMWATYNPANNRITADTNRTSNFGYDTSGNTQNDGINNYWYDAEGQLCAVQLGRWPGHQSQRITLSHEKAGAPVSVIFPNQAGAPSIAFS